MKVQVEKTALTQVLQKIQSITEKKTTMPVLSHALLKASEEGLIEFSVTDLELSLWTRIPGAIATPGSTTVSARKLLEIVRELPQDQIVLENLPNQRLLIQAGRARFELSTIPAEDFPLISFYQEAELFPCDGVLLKKALEKTLYGVPTEEDPFSIAGLYWHTLDSGETRFVSSDGHRLAYYQVADGALPNLTSPKGIIIPRKGVQELLRVLEKETEAQLGLYENALIFKTPDTFLSVQLLEAEFPEYSLIIPDERPFAFSVEWENLYHALKRVAVLTNQKWRHVRFMISNGALELESGNPELGNANDTLDIDYQGDDFAIAFNVRYVLETIQAMESQEVRFEWVDQYHGGVFIGPDDAGYLSLIMPMVV